jgi:DNA-binding transcriptional LysR family regulator
MIPREFSIFLSAAEHLNLTKASEALRVSQSFITKQLKNLETAYKAKLYRRRSRGIELTERGRGFLTVIRGIANQLEKFEQDSYAPSRKENTTIKVGGSYGPSAFLIPSVLAAFQIAHPQIDIVQRTRSRRVLERLILKSEVELAVVNSAGTDPNIESEPYRYEKLVLFVAAHHPLAKKRAIPLTDIALTSLIVRRTTQGKCDTGGHIRRMEELGMHPRVVMRCDSPFAVKMAVKRKVGVGILCRHLVESDVRSREPKVLNLPGVSLETRTFIIYHRERPLSIYATEFLKLLRVSHRRPSEHHWPTVAASNLMCLSLQFLAQMAA